MVWREIYEIDPSEQLLDEVTGFPGAAMGWQEQQSPSNHTQNRLLVVELRKPVYNVIIAKFVAIMPILYYSINPIQYKTIQSKFFDPCFGLAMVSLENNHCLSSPYHFLFSFDLRSLILKIL